MVDPHVHDETGAVILEPPIDAIADVAGTEAVADSAVRIEEIRAEKEIQLARIAAKAEGVHDETDVETLKAEVRAMREILDRLAPPPVEPKPETAPVVVDAEPEPADELAPPEAEHESAPLVSAHHKRTGLGMWQ